MNELDFIKINYNIFKNVYDNYNNVNIPIHLINKANELVEKYNCFASNYDAASLWEKKKIIASKKTTKLRSRPHLISFDFTDENKCKKEFISYLNKLTDINKEIIYKKIYIFLSKIDNKEEFSKILFDILWNFIKKSFNSIYIDIIYLFENKYIEIYWNNYINNKEWLPPIHMIENELLFKDDNYDEFCDYIKWKKCNISLCRTWIVLFKKDKKIEKINELNINILNSIEEFKKNKHIIDLLLDQIIIYLDIIPNIIIINNILSWNLNSFENSTKFKIMTISEKYK